MSCEVKNKSLHGYLDGELDVVRAADWIIDLSSTSKLVRNALPNWNRRNRCALRCSRRNCARRPRQRCASECFTSCQNLQGRRNSQRRRHGSRLQPLCY